MANGLQDSINKLEASIRHVGARITSLPVARSNSKLESLLSLPSVKKRIGFIESQDRIERLISIKRRSNRLFSADAWMEANPGSRFSSASAKVRYDDLMAKRNKREYDANRMFMRDLMSIENPAQYEKDILKEKYGFTSAGGESAAQQIRDAKAKDLRKKRRKRDRMASIAADESFKFAMLDSDEQFIQGHMKKNGWTRDQAEQVYFKEITKNAKWLRIIAKGNPIIAKNLVPIAKAVGKAGNIPILGGLVKHPALTAVGMYMQRASQEAAAAKSIVPWRNLIAAGGDISVPMWSAIAGSGADYASALQLGMESSKKAAGWKFGVGLDNIFKSGIYGSDISMFDPMASGEDRLRMIYNANKSITNPGDRLAALELWGASIDEYNAGRRLVEPRSNWSLEERVADRAQRWKTSRNWRRLHGKGWDKISADWFEPDWWIENQSIGDERAASSLKNVNGKTIWELIREIAGIDDAYRSGEYDNSVTNNETNNGKSLTVINNWGGVSVEANDPVGFIEGLEAGVGNKFVGSHAVAEWFDSKRTK